MRLEFVGYCWFIVWIYSVAFWLSQTAYIPLTLLVKPNLNSNIYEISIEINRYEFEKKIPRRKKQLTNIHFYRCIWYIGLYRINAEYTPT